MIDNFNLFVDIVLKAEGGFSNDPSDRGGATNRGITHETLRNYINDVEDRDDTCGQEEAYDRLQGLSEQDAINIYQHYYWDAVQADALPDGFDIMLADFAVNSGPYRAIKVMQDLVSVKVDGILGPRTLEAIRTRNPSKLTHDLFLRRLTFYYTTSKLDGQRRFIRGWNNRVVALYNELIQENLA